MEENGKRSARLESLGQRLRQARQQLSWSQEHLAEQIGTTAKSINRWEHDKTMPQFYYRQQLSRVFNLPMEALFDAQENEASQNADAGTQIWHVPYRCNSLFTGREDVLTHLHDLLHTNRTPSLTQSYALSGLGGIGKTQIALEYAYRFRQQYETVLWLTADTVETLVAECVQLTDLLDLPEKREQDQIRIMRAVKHWLETHRQWLLILDNVEDLASIQDFLPSTGKGHVLLTTRAQALGMLARCLDVGTMSLEEGTLFLLRRAGLLASEVLLSQATPADRAVAEEIVRVMDGLPLALDQAGAYIEETGCGIAPYLALYQQQEPRLLARRGGMGTDHPASVLTTLSLSFAQVEHQSLAAADLLRFCAFLSPDAIPEEMIVAGASHLGPHLQGLATDPLLLDEAIAILRRFSLVRRTSREQTLSVHRLVQAVLITSLVEHAQSEWAERAVRAIEHVFPADIDDVQAWPQYERCLLQALHCADLISQYGLIFAEAARLLHRTADYVADHALHKQAERLYQQALALQEQELGPEHPDTAENLNDLARLYCIQSKYEQAGPLYQRALALREQQLGPTHPETARSLNDLAELYYEQGKYEQAELLSQRALAILEQQEGPTHPYMAQSLNNLAELYRIQGKYGQAEPLFQQALEIAEQALGSKHPGVVEIMENYAILSWQTQQQEKSAVFSGTGQGERVQSADAAVEM